MVQCSSRPNTSTLSEPSNRAHTHTLAALLPGYYEITLNELSGEMQKKKTQNTVAQKIYVYIFLYTIKDIRLLQLLSDRSPIVSQMVLLFFNDE